MSRSNPDRQTDRQSGRHTGHRGVCTAHGLIPQKNPDLRNTCPQTRRKGLKYTSTRSGRSTKTSRASSLYISSRSRSVFFLPLFPQNNGISREPLLPVWPQTLWMIPACSQDRGRELSILLLLTRRTSFQTSSPSCHMICLAGGRPAGEIFPLQPMENRVLLCCWSHRSGPLFTGSIRRSRVQ